MAGGTAAPWPLLTPRMPASSAETLLRCIAGWRRARPRPLLLPGTIVLAGANFKPHFIIEHVSNQASLNIAHVFFVSVQGGDVRELDFRFFLGGNKIGAPFHGLRAFFTTPQVCGAGRQGWRGGWASVVLQRQRGRRGGAGMRRAAAAAAGRAVWWRRCS